MSTIIILSPLIIANWPAISAAVAAAAVGMGMNINEMVKEHSRNLLEEETVEIELEESEVLGSNVAAGKEMVLTKDGITIRVSRDTRGQCKICAEGKGYSKLQLKQFAEEFTQKLTQAFVYHRTVTELKNKNFQMVNEEAAEDGSIRIHVRRWVD